MDLKKTIKKDLDLIQEMDLFKSDENHFYLWWLGQSGYLLQWKGKRVLIDPYLSDSLTKKYATSDKPHTRISELVINPSLLQNISIVTSSHNHTDHLDAETLTPVIKNNPGIKFIIPEANRAFVTDRIQCEKEFPIGLNEGLSVTIDAFTFHGIPAKHNELERDENGNCKFMGYVISFGGYAIYHSGDTLIFEGMQELLKPYKVDVAILPINGNDPVRKVAGNLNDHEAVQLALDIQAGIVIPCHYDMFGFNTADVNSFIQIAKDAGQQFKVLQIGEYYKNK